MVLRPRLNGAKMINVLTFTADLRSVLEYAPRKLSKSPPADLLGFAVHLGPYVCATCTARMTERGCGSMLRELLPQWEGSDDARFLQRHSPEQVCAGCNAPFWRVQVPVPPRSITHIREYGLDQPFSAEIRCF